MVAGGHRIIAEDALKLVESLSLSTPTHGHTLVTYTSTDNRTTSTVVDRNRYNHRTTESAGSILSTCPLHTNSGFGKERRILIGPW